LWLADPETRTVTVYRETLVGTELDEGARLNGDDVLPGFSCQVAELFE
jgi:Uma2 family endonuclease